MPQPVTLDSSSKPRHALLSRPACAIQIAAIVGEWAYVEDSLSLMFSGAMGPHRKLDDGSVSLDRNWTALVAMREIDSIHMRLKIVEKTLIPLLPAALRARWEELEKGIRARARERNLVAHASWSLSDRYPADVIFETDVGQMMRYTERDFAEILERITAINVQTHEFLQAVLEAQRNGTARLVNH